MSGIRERPSPKGRVRCATVSTGRCFRRGSAGTLVRMSRVRYTEESPFVKCQEESWVLNIEREGKD